MILTFLLLFFLFQFLLNYQMSSYSSHPFILLNYFSLHAAIELPKDPMVITASFTPLKERFKERKKRKKDKLYQLNSSRKRKELIPPDK